MPKVAGILDIVAGGFGILICFFIPFLLAVTLIYIGLGPSFGMGPSAADETAAQSIMLFMVVWAVFVVAMAILAIIGGISALRKKNWRLALAGSIGAIISSWPLGIPAIIFTVMGKNQFE